MDLGAGGCEVVKTLRSFGINAYGVESNQFPLEENCPELLTQESKNITIELERGVLVTGRVVDEESGKPIVNELIRDGLILKPAQPPFLLTDRIDVVGKAAE